MPLLSNEGFRKYRSALGGTYPTTTGVNVGSYMEDTDTGLIYQYLPVSASTYRWFPVQSPWLSLAGIESMATGNVGTKRVSIVEKEVYGYDTFPYALTTPSSDFYVSFVSLVCVEAFDNATTLYSVGDSADNDRYLKPFFSTQSVGFVRTFGGVSFGGNFDFENIPSNTVNLYRSSGSNSYGCFHVRIGLSWFDGNAFPGIYGPLFFVQAGGTDVSGITDQVDATSLVTGTQVEAGSLSQSLRNHAGCGRDQLAFVIGGDNGASLQNEIRFFHCLYSTDTVTDKGDLSSARDGISAVSHPSATTVMCAGGWTGIALSNVIEYISATQTTENASDKGDLITAIRNMVGVTNGRFAFFAGGQTGPVSDQIERVDMTTGAQNSVDIGDLTIARHSMAGMSGLTYGVFSGGYTGSSTSNVMDSIAMTISYVNATDKGDLVTAVYQHAGASDLSTDTGYVSGGYTSGGSLYGTVSDVDLSLLVSNATTFGSSHARRGHSAAV